MSGTNEVNESLALHELKLEQLGIAEKVGLGVFLLGLGTFFLAAITGIGDPAVMFYSSFLTMTVGGLFYIFKHFLKFYPGIRNNNIMTASNSSRGYVGIAIGIILTGFYCVFIGEAMVQLETNKVCFLDILVCFNTL